MSEEARAKILRWTKEEGTAATAVVTQAQKDAWRLRLPMGALHIEIYQTKGAPNFIVAAGVQLDGVHLEGYKALSEDEKAGFQNTIMMQLVPHIPDFQMEGTPDSLRVIVASIVYPDDLTRQFFFDRVRLVHHLATSVKFIAASYFRSMGAARP